jgi:hypothetical protein
MGTGGKARDADHSPPSAAKIKRLHCVQRDSFTLLYFTLHKLLVDDDDMMEEKHKVPERRSR